jgi:dipeptidyl aminopeptidase/acylaminoacyl peptidase
MNRTTDLEQVLRVHFNDHADATVLDGQLDRIVDRVATVRQRPGWMLPERWLPMSAISARFAAAPRVPLRVFALALLVLALAVSALLVAGALRHSVPPPFGPAGNGLIAYADGSGAINVGDPVTGSTKLVVPGPGKEQPIFSPDGTHIAFVTGGARGGKDVIVVRADGSNPVKLTTDPLSSVGFLGWSPDSVSVVVGNSAGELVTFDSTHVGPAVSLGTSATLDGFNATTAEIYQPPAGQKVLTLRTTSSRPSLVVTDRDGTNERVVIDGTQADSFLYIQSPQWSPDGSMISFLGARRDVIEDYLTYVMNADGSGLHQLSKASRPINESNPAWAPDSKRIALQRWLVDPTAGTQEVRPITVVDVLTGKETEVGVTPVANGFIGWSWSPDGQSILEIPIDDVLFIANVGNGTAHPVPWTLAGSAPSWQRVSP